jgi:hypothetical protein
MCLLMRERHQRESYAVFPAAAVFAAHRAFTASFPHLKCPPVHAHTTYTSEALSPHVLRLGVVEATPAQKWLA